LISKPKSEPPRLPIVSFSAEDSEGKFMHYFQFNIGDYRAATAHLSNEEDLAYRRLLDMYYDTEQKIPLDTQWVAKRLRMTIQVVDGVLQDMFVKHEDGWFHAKCDDLIQQYHAMAEKNRTNGRLGGRKKNPVGIPMATDSEPIAKATINYKLETINQEDKYICPPNGELDDKAGLPKCNHQAIVDLYHKHLPTLRRVEVWNDTRKGYLRQRWREVAEELAKDKKAEISDVLTWFTEFFDHIGQSKFLTGRVNSKDGRAFLADLEWILKPSNFAKIVEGKYHGTH
jgi:uncharacterized protein YdaU (DUF1376 family)